MTTEGVRLTPLVRIAFLVLMAAWCCAGQAQVPDQINYQGRLTDQGGNPVTASVPMVFKLYTASSSGGAAIYSEAQTVPVTEGIFTVAIGAVTPLNLPFDVPYYIGVTVGTDAEMVPRQAVLSSPYAQRAGTANLLASSATVPAVQITGTLTTSQLGNGSVTKPKLSAAGGTAGQVLGTDGSDLLWQSTGALWGQVRSDGALQLHSGGISASRRRTGVYVVSFPQSVSQCALNISASQFLGAGIIAVNSSIADPPNSSSVFFSAYEEIGTTNSLAIGAYSAGGTLVDTPFSIAMICQ